MLLCWLKIPKNLNRSSLSTSKSDQNSEISWRSQSWIQVSNGTSKASLNQFSLGTPEILLKWQQYEHENIRTDITVFEMAERENINIVGCSPLFQGKVANLPFSNKKMDYLKHNSAKHLQLMRSFYSPSLLTTLVGQTESSHIDNNLSLLEFPRLTTQEWR